MTKPRLKMPLSNENPSPFIQPFLVLGFEEKEGDWKMTWHVDVGGEIWKYLHIDELSAYVRPDSNLLKGGNVFMTSLLRQLIDDLAKNNLHVERVGAYGPGASGGPSHYLRNGAFFERIS